jgi:serine/threonine-protein kinase
MAPEQIREMDVDRRADVFSAGVVLFEALANTRLFGAENALATMRRVLTDPPPDPAKYPSIPGPLHAVVAKALSHDRDARFADCAELAAAIAQRYAPATHGEVAALLDRHCGELLLKRRELLTVARSSASETPLAPSSSPPALSPSGGEVSETNHQDDTTQGDDANDTGVAAPKIERRRNPLVWVGALAVAAAALGGLAKVQLARRSDGATQREPATALASVTSASTVTAAPSAHPPDAPVVLGLTADAPIKSVRAAGVRSVEVNGRSARVVVAPWVGELVVDATLDGKPDARARIAAGGPPNAQLVPVVPVPAVVPRPRKAPPAPAPDELQSSPYSKGRQ